MKVQKIIPIVLFCLLLAACNKDDNPQNQGADATVDKLATNITVMSKAIEVYGDALATTQDSISAINTLGQWLIDQPEVGEAYYWSTSLVEIHFENGLRSSILFVKVDKNGEHLQRGGGGGGDFVRFKSTSSNDIEPIRNNKILVLNPFVRDFYRDGGYKKRAMLENGKLPMEVTILDDNAVTYSTLATLSNYGLVILNTHGVPNGFMLSRLFDVPDTTKTEQWTREQVLEALNKQGDVLLDKFENNELILDMLVTVDIYKLVNKTAIFLVTEKYIRNSTLEMKDAVVFANHCYSGYTASGPNIYNMPQAWRSKGVNSYFGYAFKNNSSSLVWNDFARQMEDSLIVNLVQKGDTTGVAHLANDVTEMFDHRTFPAKPTDLPKIVQRGIIFVGTEEPGNLTFTQFFETNYAYSNCRDTITDERDSQKYAVACIGDQKWMAQNLNWNGAGLCYDNNPANCNTYGRLYSITELTGLETSDENPSTVTGICPKGWHVPSKAEYEELIAFCGGEAEATDMLRSVSGWPSAHSNSTGFDLKPAGHYSTDGITSIFRNMGVGAKLWTSSKDVSGLYYAVNAYHPGFYLGTYTAAGQEWYFSCRCVED